MFEYDVVAVKSRAFGDWSYAETRLQETLNAHARAGWRVVWMTRERNRMLVTFERPKGQENENG